MLSTFPPLLGNHRNSSPRPSSLSWPSLLLQPPLSPSPTVLSLLGPLCSPFHSLNCPYSTDLNELSSVLHVLFPCFRLQMERHFFRETSPMSASVIWALPSNSPSCYCSFRSMHHNPHYLLYQVAFLSSVSIPRINRSSGGTATLPALLTALTPVPCTQ